MLPLIISHANDSFYKIASEALLVLQELVKIIRPKSSVAIQNEFKPFVEQIYECTQKRLKQKDFDQEVKERAITCFAYVIVYLGDLLSSDQLQSCWPVLIDLLRNEITRLPTVRALTNIVESPLNLDLQTVLTETVPILSSYLRQNHRTLKMNTLSCLRSMIKIYSKHFDKKTLIKTILAQYALKLTTAICKINTNQTTIDKEQIHSILNKVLELIQSPLLQGTALDAVIEFLRALVPQCISYEELVKLLIKPVYSQLKSSTTASATATNANDPHHPQQQQLVVHKQAFYSIAKSFAALTVANLKESSYFIKKFQDDLNDPKCSDSIKILALLCLGETGKIKLKKKIFD
jgi:cullin-associated NEDD8-dissociated protein 1